jgi:hypothetical protein
MVILLIWIQNRQNRSTPISVESREPTNDSGFFHLKHSDTIDEQKNYTLKISAGDHPLKKIPSDHGNMITRYDAAGRFQGQNLKTKSQNRK